MTTDETRDRLVDVLAGPLAQVGLDVEGVELAAAGKRRVLRVAVDKDGGVSLDDVADATREVSRVLDESDLMGERPYTLEVSSPGTDRPLRLPRHWRRNRDRLVTVARTDGPSLTGRIGDCDDESAVVEVDGVPHRVRFDAVTTARVQVELRRHGRHDEGEEA